ncbi:aminotransferase class III-fold pyridoxal phosphate-dependent enzyme [Staphylococcus aureus]|nr:aminotransferase class III-fold pyridoxal phosphate-dependent enzyme [Staphylococcus aureus]
MDRYAILNGQLTTNNLHDIEIVRGENHTLIDVNNRKYIDLSSGLWNVSLGYNKELNYSIKEKITEILDKNIPYLDITSYFNKLYNSTAENLLKFIDEKMFNRVIYTNSGSESLELSLKIVNSIMNGKYIVSFSESYHGTFYGGMSISGISKDIVKAHKPNYENKLTLSLPNNSQEENQFINYVDENSNEIGAIFIEPIIGSGGIKYCSLNFYNTLIKLCKQKDIIVIFDEVATGFYKTGKKFFFKYLQYKPDILCLSKGLNNGTLPSGAVIISKEIENLLSDKTLKHMSTQNGNLLCISTIQATIDYYINKEIEINSNIKKIHHINNLLTSQYKINARIFGTIIAIPVKKSVLNFVLDDIKQNGVLVYRFVTTKEAGISIFPPINIDEKIYRKTLNLILKTIKKYGEIT